jgi:predicted phosphodiesterase
MKLSKKYAFRFGIFLGLGALAACSSSPPRTSTSETTVDSAWTELGPDGITLARAISSGACPPLIADGKKLPMNLRGVPSLSFPAKVCEATMPEGSRDLRIGNIILSAGTPNIHRILFLGDTGCKVKKAKDGQIQFQDCNDPNKWPFSVVAESAAAWKPDLVIHVGDYHYREADCPANERGCAGSITGDRWGSWRQDFFVPAQPLLRAAPWIFVRGNHELCQKAGNGWFRLLDPRPFPDACQDSTSVYEVPIPEHRLYVIDSADDQNIAPSLASVAPSTKKDYTWLLIHRPFLTPGADDEAHGQTKLPGNLSSSGAISAIFAGHHHTLSLNQFKDSRPPEMITGNGGDTLEPFGDNLGKDIQSFQFRDFGFLTLESRPDSNTSIMQEHDRNGKVVKACQLREKFGEKTELHCDN